MQLIKPGYFSSVIQTSTPAQWAAFQCALGSPDQKLNNALNYLKISPGLIAPALRKQSLHTVKKWMSSPDHRPQVVMALFRTGRLLDAKQNFEDIAPSVLCVRPSLEKVVDGKVLGSGQDKQTLILAGSHSPYRDGIGSVEDDLQSLKSVLGSPQSTQEKKLEVARKLSKRLHESSLTKEELKVVCNQLISRSSYWFLEDTPEMSGEILSGIVCLLRNPEMESLLKEDFGFYRSLCSFIKELKSKPWKQEVVFEDGAYKIVDRYAAIRGYVLEIGDYLVSRNIGRITHDDPLRRRLELLRITHTHQGLHDLTAEEVAATQASGLYSIPGSGKGIEWVRSGAVIGAVAVWAAVFTPIAMTAIVITLHMAIVYGAEFANTPGLFFRHFFEFLKEATLDAVLFFMLHGLIKSGSWVGDWFLRYEESHPLYYKVLALKRAARRQSQLADQLNKLSKPSVTQVRVNVDDVQKEDPITEVAAATNKAEEDLKKKK
ncbi:MAG: hypothetical protein IPJ69_13005 [Deltaproteobacteria bacterium]|nr:MAG: hypothetical protein IPJ69_13005 [Deltaproteobacteria bacterium]